jgi:hypothetical protein
MKSYIIKVIFLFLFFLVVFLPAKMMLYFVPNSNQLDIQHLDGTLWSGTVAHLSINKINLNNVHYTIRFLDLLVGKIGLNLKLLKGDVKGKLAISGNQSAIDIEGANIKFLSALIEPFLPMNGIELMGNIKTHNFSLSMLNKKPNYVKGLTQWNQAKLILNGKMWDIGDLKILWNTDKNGIKGYVNKTKNIFDLQGKIKISPKGLLVFTGSVSNDLDEQILTVLTMFFNGKKSNGRVKLSFKKQL